MESIYLFASKLFSGNYEAMLFTGILCFMWLTYLFDLYLEYRQHKILICNVKPTKETSMIMNDENFSKARLYSIDTKRFGAYHNFYNMMESSIILCCNILPLLWSYCTTAITYSDSITESQELMASLVLILISAMYSFVTGMPWKVYSTFVIEARHGFNKQTPWFFIKDQVKSLLLSIVLMIPISYCLLFIIKRGGPYFYVYAWAFAFVVMLFLMFIYPEFIAPLFDKYTPLADGDLKQNIEQLAREIGFPLAKLYVVEGSKRSSHSNAYFYGFWKNKRIVLFDTLIENYESPNSSTTEGDKEPKTEPSKGCNNEEIVAVLGHELGHWKLNHVLQNMIISQVNVFLMFFMFGLLFNMDVLFKAFGFIGPNTPTIIRLLLIVSYLFSPYNFVLEFLMTLLTRKNEFQADNFATRLGKGGKLINALIKLQNDNLSFPIYDRLYSLFNHSHPPVLERIEAIGVEMDSKKIQ